MAELIGRGEVGGGTAEEGGRESLERSGYAGVRVRVWGSGEAVAPPVEKVAEEEEEEDDNNDSNGEVNGDENGARERAVGTGANGDGGEGRRREE
jgi:hypothetical protein